MIRRLGEEREIIAGIEGRRSGRGREEKSRSSTRREVKTRKRKVARSRRGLTRSTP